MSRKNRKISKRMSVNTAIATHFGAVIAFLFVMVILNLLANSSCQQLAKTIGDEEKELARLEDARNREETRWLEMQTPKRIEKALLANGRHSAPTAMLPMAGCGRTLTRRTCSSLRSATRSLRCRAAH